MNCLGCSCVNNYATNKGNKSNSSNKNSEFCGRLVRGKDDKLTTMGCNKKCPQCKLCKYPHKNSDYTPPKPKTEEEIAQEIKKNKQNRLENGKLDQQEFLEFLERQEELNKQEESIYGVVVKNEKNNNKKSNSLDKLENNLKPPDNFNQNNGINNVIAEPEEHIRCLDFDMDSCVPEKGCTWNPDSITCSNLMVSFYTNEKLKGEHYDLGVGNYDIADVENMDFYPEYISVPQGLRVKIWHKEGFVGMYDAYLGNHIPKNIQETHLYKLKNLGSIQICNMIKCNKPSPYAGMKLVNIMDGNNIDRIDKNEVKNMLEYKNKLRKNIINRIKYIKRTQHECVSEIINYLRHNGINLHKNFDQEGDIGHLQKVKFLLNNIPSCDNLQIYKNYRNPNEEKRISSMLEKRCQKDDAGECEINQNFTELNNLEANSLNTDLEIDNNMLNTIENNLKNNNNNLPGPVDSNSNNNNLLGPVESNSNNNNLLGPVESNSNNNNLLGPVESNSNNNNNNINNSNKNSKIRNLLEKINILKVKEPEIIYKESPAITKTVFVESPAITKTVFVEAPAITKIVYEKAPAETKIEYVFQDSKAAPTDCSKREIANDFKFLGVKVKDNVFLEVIYRFMETDLFKQITVVLTILFIIAYFVRRRSR